MFLVRSIPRGEAILVTGQHTNGSMLGCHDDEDLREADPDTLRYRIWHLPARLAHHARQRILKISPGWPWKDAFLTCWRRLCALPAPA